MIELQERDRKLIELGYEQRVLKLEHVKRFLFPKATMRIVKRRMLLLERSGLIRREVLGDSRSRNLIRIGRGGVALAEKGRTLLVPQPKLLDPDTVLHDALVTLVRLRLEELWDGKWIPEGLLKAEELPQIPDGLWIFPNGNRVAIEVENSPKGEQRFHQIQERWRDVDIALVLYVATNVTMERLVRDYISGGPKDLPFGLVRLDQLEKGTPSVWTMLKELPLLSRRSF